MNATQETFAQFESLKDLKNPPTNWEGAMEAVIAGVIDFDEAEPLCLACCKIIDDAYGNVCITPSQPKHSDDIPKMLERLVVFHQSGEEPSDFCAQQFRAMGHVADVLLAQKAAKS